MRIPVLVAMLSMLGGVAARAGEGVRLAVKVPAGTRVKAAVAQASSLKLETVGAVTKDGIRFEKLLADTPYELRVTLDDGTVLQGVDMSWHSDEPAKEDAGELSDDDREQVRAIVADIPRFYNKCEILRLQGDHDRATALVRLVRDKQFVNDQGGEIVWRIELWYFKNQAGGWEAINQQNKVLRRERFRDRKAYAAEADHIRWVPELGGIKAPRGGRSITLPSP
jgi:hypothetical protein